MPKKREEELKEEKEKVMTPELVVMRERDSIFLYRERRRRNS